VLSEIPKVVFSESTRAADWGPATIARGDPAAAVTASSRSAAGARSAKAVCGSRGRWSKSARSTRTAWSSARSSRAGERRFTAPLAIEPVSSTAFGGGAAAHVFAAPSG